ncbi:MAG: hypothetical protein ACRD3N_17830 [Terracidiphilus sp.]
MKTPDLKRTWHFVLPVLMIVLLMITAVGMVCHHHDGASACNCMLCHMALEPALSGMGQSEFVLRSTAAILQQDTLLSRLSASETSPRAPPARPI